MVLATKEATCSRKIHKSNLSENLYDLKFIYSEKAIKILRNLHQLFVLCTASQLVEISQNFMAFLEYMNFKIWKPIVTFNFSSFRNILQHESL